MSEPVGRRRLSPIEFRTLRSIGREPWSEADGTIQWKFHRKWVDLYREDYWRYSSLIAKARTAVEELLSLGLVVRVSARRCCNDATCQAPFHDELHLSESGKLLLARANSASARLQTRDDVCDHLMGQRPAKCVAGLEQSMTTGISRDPKVRGSITSGPNRTMDLQSLVNVLSSRAQIAPPRVKLWRNRNARYNAATHGIAVSGALADGLNEAQLHTLLAHEVGHASRRANTLRRVLKYLFPPLLILLATAAIAFSVGGFSAAQDVARGLRAWGALLVTGIGILVAARVHESIERQARRDAYAEELRADRFAKRHGDPNADVASVLEACAQIEGSGMLGPEAMRRIRFARRLELNDRKHGSG